MNDAPAPRHGSFLETWRLFANGGALLGAISVLGFAAIFVPFLMNGKFVPFAVFAFMVLFMSAFGTWILEASLASRLAFMTLVPQPVDPKWLVLAPMCALGVAVAIITATLGRSPALASLALLGLAWWTTASARWAMRLPFALLLALPLLLLGFAATYLAHRIGGWGAAAAVAMACGLVALAFQPRVVLDVASTPRRSPSPSPGPPREDTAASVPYAAASRVETGRAVWLMSAVRFLLISTAQMRRLHVVMFVSAAVFAATVADIPGGALFMLVLFVPKGTVTEPYSRERFEFIRPLPFSGRQRFVAGVVIPLLIALALPVLMTALVDLDRINNGNFIARVLRVKIPHDSTLTYLRDALGATFLPEKWPAGGLTQDMWLRIRPLIWLDLPRTAAILVASLFGGALLHRDGKAAWLFGLTSFAIQMVALLAAGRLAFGRFGNLPVPPLWFASLLAAIAVAIFAWRARAVSSSDGPAPATGSSTPG